MLHRNITVNLTEHRAPTDESVRLLKELEQAARAEVQASIRVANTALTGVIHLHRDYLTCRTHVKAHIKLNNKQVVVDIVINPITAPEKVPEFIIAKLGEAIAVQALSDLLTPQQTQELLGRS